ncbi:MAG: AAA family ATPase [Acidimicrobiales bacterium]|nr:AAA family ATPase [Acidimicrobiales bacterium]
MSEGGIVTVLFTDVVNSTELLARLGDDRAETVRRAHFATLRQAIAKHDGREVKTMGDGFMMVFTSAVDALACAVTIQQAASTSGVEMRVGLHVGEPMRDGDDYFGTPVVIASRLCDAAAGGQILTSDLLHALVGNRGGFSFHDAGYLALKGLSEPVAAWEVAWHALRNDALALPGPLLAGERLAFVGRNDHLHQLRVHLKKAQDGHRALVMLAGEPGIGKTRLASEFAQVAHDEGAIVLFGRSDEETLLPYQPFVEALHHLVRSLAADELISLVGPNAGELARLLPALHHALPEWAEPMRSDPDSERYRLFEATAELFVALAVQAPVVLVLDDLHWADKPSLLLLEHLFRGPTDFALLVVGTYRDTDLDRRHPLASTLADLRRLLPFDRLALSGLGEDDLTHFIDLTTGHEPPPGFAAAIYDQTEGNPFFIGETLRHLVESGAVSVVDGEWTSASAIEDLGIPEGVTEVIGRRLSRLSEQANTVLAAAAVAGRDFELNVLERVTEIDEDQLLGALDEAVGARLVVELPGLAGRFHFAHALVRETLYDELSTARRVRMHRRVAQALEAAVATDGEQPLAQLAYHWFEAASAGDVDKVVEYSLRAGERALAQLAYEEAATNFERALQAVDLLDKADDSTRCELLLLLGDAQDRMADRADSQATFERAALIGRQLDSTDLFARAALGRAGVLVPGIIDRAALALLEEAHGRLGDDESALHVRVLARWSLELYFTEAHERAPMQPLADRALAMARRVGDPAALGYALNSAFMSDDHYDDVDRRIDMTTEALAIGEETNDATLTHWARLWLSYALLEKGDVDGFGAQVDAEEVLARTVKLPVIAWYVPLWRGTQAFIRGDLVEAERLAMEAFTLGQEAHDDASLQMFGVQLYALRFEQGRLDEVESTIAGLVEQFPTVPAWRVALAMLVAELGRGDEAREALEVVARDGFATLPRDANWLISMALMARTSLLLGTWEHAHEAYRSLLPFEHLFVVIGQAAEWYGSVARCLGELATAAGLYDEAVQHFERAVQADGERGAHRFRLHANWGMATALLRRDRPGDGERARALISKTEAEAEQRGLVSLTRRLRDLA